MTALTQLRRRIRDIPYRHSSFSVLMKPQAPSQRVNFLPLNTPSGVVGSSFELLMPSSVEGKGMDEGWEGRKEEEGGGKGREAGEVVQIHQP